MVLTPSLVSTGLLTVWKDLYCCVWRFSRSHTIFVSCYQLLFNWSPFKTLYTCMVVETMDHLGFLERTVWNSIVCLDRNCKMLHVQSVFSGQHPLARQDGKCLFVTLWALNLAIDSQRASVKHSVLICPQNTTVLLHQGLTEGVCPEKIRGRFKVRC